MNDSITDQELMQRIVSKDAEALRYVYEKYEKPLYVFGTVKNRVRLAIKQLRQRLTGMRKEELQR